MYYHNHRGRAFSLSLIAVIIILAGSAHGAIIVVPDDHPTIQAAINAAGTGDTIQVNSGTYDENVVVNKSLILEGLNTGSGLPAISPTITGDAIILTVPSCTVRAIRGEWC